MQCIDPSACGEFFLCHAVILRRSLVCILNLPAWQSGVKKTGNSFEYQAHILTAVFKFSLGLFALRDVSNKEGDRTRCLTTACLYCEDLATFTPSSEFSNWRLEVVEFWKQKGGSFTYDFIDSIAKHLCNDLVSKLDFQVGFHRKETIRTTVGEGMTLSVSSASGELPGIVFSRLLR